MVEEHIIIHQNKKASVYPEVLKMEYQMGNVHTQIAITLIMIQSGVMESA